MCFKILKKFPKQVSLSPEQSTLYFVGTSTFVPTLSLRATWVYLLLCSCCSCSCEDISQNTAVFANFVQFHHAFSAVGRQHIASFINTRGSAAQISANQYPTKEHCKKKLK
jgi:hypothetical protein